jgi:uncharacterized protein (UPF0332 family)
MSLTEEERESVVQFRIEKAKNTFAEIALLAANNLWQTAANRLYYACYYAVSALLVQNGIEAFTHHGVINQLGLHFVKTGFLPAKQGKFYQQLFELRQTSDYSDWIIIKEENITSLIEPAEHFIAEIDRLIKKRNRF